MEGPSPSSQKSSWAQASHLPCSFIYGNMNVVNIWTSKKNIWIRLKHLKPCWVLFELVRNMQRTYVHENSTYLLSLILDAFPHVITGFISTEAVMLTVPKSLGTILKVKMVLSWAGTQPSFIKTISSEKFSWAI